MKLYAMCLIKGKQLFQIGDNIKDHLNDKDDFKQFRKPLEWGIDFKDEIYSMHNLVKMKDGYFNGLGQYEPPKKEKELINQCLVIVSGEGVIKGIIEINKNNREELKGE